jgi:hypothetical protein
MVAIGRSMPVVLDTYRFVTALRGTGKNANFTAEEIARAIDVSQQGSDVLTKSAFDVAMAGIDTRFARLEATLGTFDAKFETLRADIKAEVKSSQVQNLLWLSGIVLASNGVVIALLARIAEAI